MHANLENIKSEHAMIEHQIKELRGKVAGSKSEEGKQPARMSALTHQMPSQLSSTDDILSKIEKELEDLQNNYTEQLFNNDLKKHL